MSPPTDAPFKRFAEPVLGKMLQPASAGGGDALAPYLKAGHVSWEGLNLPEELPEMWANPGEVAMLHPNIGDLLICEGGEVGRATLVNTSLAPSTIIQNSLHLVRRGPRTDTRYLKYALEKIAHSGWLDVICNKATIAHLTVDKLRELRLPYRSFSEQEQIANFLDDKTARIDALIAEKESLLDTLETAREAHAFHAATGGPVASSKTCGRAEEWLREVPSHWPVPKLGYFADVGNGCTPRREIEEYWLNGTVPWITSTEVNDRVIRETAQLITPLGVSESHLRPVRPGSAIVGLVGQGPTRGMTAQLAIAATLSQNVAYVSVNRPGVLDEYLIVALTGMYSALRFLSDGSGGAQGAMNCDTLRNFRLPMPPEAEQVRIVKTFRKREAALGDLQAHAREHVERLREYRSSLISAAVTGQLDISTFKVSTPANEPEPELATS